MSNAVTEKPASLDRPRNQWTRDECRALARAGLIDVERYELIEGELYRKMGKNHEIRPEDFTKPVDKDKQRASIGVVKPSTDVLPEDTPTSEPEPDAIVLTRSFLELSGNPRPEEVRLIVEVSDTTLAFDSIVKARLYARSGKRGGAPARCAARRAGGGRPVPGA